MPVFLTFAFSAALILLANQLAVTGTDRQRFLFDRLLMLINLGLLLFGTLFGLVPAELFESFQREGAIIVAPGAFGATIALMGVWGIVASTQPVRVLLARWLPIKPGSPVHALALVMSGYLIGGTALTLTQGGLEELATTAAPANVVDIATQFILFVFLALFGVGLLIRRDGPELVQRLGLENLNGQHLLVGLRWIAVLVVLQWIFGAISMLLNPGQIELVDEISSSLLGEIDTVGEWLILALATGIGEELLFRGAIQPALGLGVTAFLFATAHVQYGITPITLAILIIGLILGRIRRDYSTTLSMFVHTGYNLVLGLMSLLLQPLAG